MTPKRLGILAGGVLAGTLLLGTAVLVAAQDPAPPIPSMGGTGMMGGPGMMGGTGMKTSEQLAQMDALHDQMVAGGWCDMAPMQQFHAQHHPTT